MRPLTDGLSLDQARLLPRAREQAVVLERIRLERRQAAVVLDVVVSAGPGVFPLRWKAEPGDLRGIPVLARGVGGAQPGSTSRDAVANVDRERERRGRAA